MEIGIGRLAGVLVAPVKTFRSIAERPTWWAALVVIMLSSAGVGLLAAPRLDWDDIIRQQVAKSGREVPQEQLDRQIAFVKKARTPLLVTQAVVAPLFICLLALVPWTVYRLLGSELDYGRSVAVALHAAMPPVLAALLSIPVLLSRSTLGYEDVRAGSFLKSNLAALVATSDTGAPVYALLSSLDFFSLWTWTLLFLGFREVAKVSTAKAATTTAVLWLLFVGVKVGWAALFG